MQLWALAFFLFSGLAILDSVSGADVTVRSGPAQASLLELFTSEGCSSCPPAEAWFSGLRQSPSLWKEVVPISFHVNYWDNLGWPDALAREDFTDRQRRYAAAWGSNSVYTPGFVLNGQEWRSRDLHSIPDAKSDAGFLSATLKEGGEVVISFSPPHLADEKWQAHAALLGFGVSSNVRAGENSGRTLVHDFVVLDLQEATMEGKAPTVAVHLAADKIRRGEGALAVWITPAGSIQPVQAAGGDL